VIAPPSLYPQARATALSLSECQVSRVDPIPHPFHIHDPAEAVQPGVLIAGVTHRVAPLLDEGHRQIRRGGDGLDDRLDFELIARTKVIENCWRACYAHLFTI
jgi:hypothetical protein